MAAGVDTWSSSAAMSVAGIRMEAVQAGPVVPGDGIQRGRPRPAVRLLHAAARVADDRAAPVQLGRGEPPAERGVGVDRGAATQPGGGGGEGRERGVPAAQQGQGRDLLRDKEREVEGDLPAEGVADDVQAAGRSGYLGGEPGGQRALSVAGIAGRVMAGDQTVPDLVRHAATPSQTAGVSGVPCSRSQRSCDPLIHPPCPIPRRHVLPQGQLRPATARTRRVERVRCRLPQRGQPSHGPGASQAVQCPRAGSAAARGQSPRAYRRPALAGAVTHAPGHGG